MKPDDLHPWAALGFTPEERKRIAAIAKRLRVSVPVTLAAIIRSAIGVSYHEGSLAYRLVDACNEIETIMQSTRDERKQ